MELLTEYNLDSKISFVVSFVFLFRISNMDIHDVFTFYCLTLENIMMKCNI